MEGASLRTSRPKSVRSRNHLCSSTSGSTPLKIHLEPQKHTCLWLEWFLFASLPSSLISRRKTTARHDTWMWLNMQQLGFRRWSMFPLTRLPFRVPTWPQPHGSNKGATPRGVQLKPPRLSHGPTRPAPAACQKSEAGLAPKGWRAGSLVSFSYCWGGKQLVVSFGYLDCRVAQQPGELFWAASTRCPNPLDLPQSMALTGRSRSRSEQLGWVPLKPL